MVLSSLFDGGGISLDGWEGVGSFDVPLGRPPGDAAGGSEVVAESDWNVDA